MKQPDLRDEGHWMKVRPTITGLQRTATLLLAACAIFPCALLFFAVVSAQDRTVPPIPEPRPPVRFAEPTNLLVAKPKDEQESDADADAGPPTLPRSRPDNGRPIPDPDDAIVVAPGLLEPVETSAEDIEACRWRLRGLGVSFERWPTIDRGGQCRIDLPMLVSELSPDVALDPAAMMRCELAETLATWMRDIVTPAARNHLGSDVNGLIVTSAFHCRSGGPDALVDAHAAGSAVDIVALTFKGRNRLSVRDRRAEQGSEGTFQREILVGACKLFPTVLSPGADFGSTETDARHFHFDIGKRRDGQRICR